MPRSPGDPLAEALEATRAELRLEGARADAAERERDALLAQNVGEGHGSPCYYCGDPCNALAGSPTRWPIPLCHADDPGRVKWHHIGCVSARLRGHDPTLAEVSAEADRYAGLPAPVDDPLLSLARTRAAWLTLAGAAVAALRAMPDVADVGDAHAVTDDPSGGGGSFA